MKTKKLLSMLLSLILVASLLPMSALAAAKTEFKIAPVYWEVHGTIPMESEGYTEYYHPYGTECLFSPYMMIDGDYERIDPSKVYTENEEDLIVAPSDYVTGYLDVTLLTKKGGELLYDHTDGKTYSVSIIPTLPIVGFYSEAEASMDTILTSFHATDTQDTIYLIATEGYTIKDILLPDFPAETTITLNEDNTIATITIGHSFVSNLYTMAEITVKASHNNFTYTELSMLALTADYPGLFYRYSDFRESEIEMEDGDPMISFTFEPGEQEIYYAYFFDGTEEHKVSGDLLYSVDPALMTVEPVYGNNSFFVKALHCGESALAYTHTDGKEYRIPTACKLPEIGIFSEREYAEEYFVNETNVPVSEHDSTFYIMLSDTSDTLFKDVILESFPEGSTWEIAPDERSIAITVNNPETLDALSHEATIQIKYSAPDIFIFGVYYLLDEYLYINLNYPGFTDVTPQDWFYDAVQWAVNQRITGGLAPNSFGPNNACTRAQVVTFLYAAAGKPEINPEYNPFTDVSESDWFYAPVMWAVENGITGGLTPDSFGPNATCTRAQVVTFLYAAAGKPQMDAAESPFTDVMSGDWYLNPVLWAVEKGVTSGLTPDTFGPNNTCTRAQVVTFLYANETK